MQRGILVDVGTALAPGAIGELQAAGKYFVFFSNRDETALADKFGARFVDALEGDICRTQAFTPESLAAIAARELNHLAQRVKAQCGLVLAMGSDVRDLVAAQYGKTSGMTAMRDYVDSIYRAFAEYVLDADDIPTAGTPAKLTVDGSRLMAAIGSGEPFDLLALLPRQVLAMASRDGARALGRRTGQIVPGYTADLIVLSDLEKFAVEQVYKKGKLVAQQGKMLHPAALAVDKARFARVFDSFNMDEITPEQLQLKQTGTRQRVICLTPHALLTTEKIVPFCQHPGTAPGVDVAQKIVKLAVFERHQRSGHVGLGFLGNYGLQCGAVASSIAHDSHNLIVAGTNDADMVLAGNTVRKNKGGLAFALNGRVVGELPLPVAGLMSTESAETVEEKLQALKAALKAHGISDDIDAFMTLAFVSLPVIPKLRLNTYGIVDVDAQQIVPAVF